MVEVIINMLEGHRDKYKIDLTKVVSLAGNGIAVIDMIKQLQTHNKYFGPPVEKLLIRFWKAVVLLDESNWITIAMEKSPEQKALEIRKGTALYHLIVACFNEVQNDNIDKSWFIKSLSAENSDIFIKETGLLRKRIGKDGHLKESDKDNPMILKTIREAIELAHREADMC